MIVRPMFNLVLLPDINYYFKNDFLKDWSLFPIEEKEEILFLVLRENKSRAELQPDDFYPIGVSAKIETVEEDGNLRIHTLERVNVSCIEIHDGYIEAKACVRAEGSSAGRGVRTVREASEDTFTVCSAISVGDVGEKLYSPVDDSFRGSLYANRISQSVSG